MKRFWFGPTLAVATLLTFGCNGQPAASKPAAPNAPAKTTTVAATTPAAEPIVTGKAVQSLTPASEAVTLFLENLKAGNAAQATSLLTKEAQAELSRRAYELNQIGSPEAVFQVGRTQFADANQDAALVECAFTEPAAEGEPEKTETVFEVHLEDGSWRIKGFAVDMGPDQPEAVIDFEALPANEAPAAEGKIAETPAPQSTTR